MFSQNTDSQFITHLVNNIEFNNSDDDEKIPYHIIDTIYRSLNLKSIIKNKYTLKNAAAYNKFFEHDENGPCIMEWCNIYYYENYIKNSDVENHTNDDSDYKCDVEKDYDFRDKDLEDPTKYTNVKITIVEFDCRNMTKHDMNVIEILRMPNIYNKTKKLVEYLDAPTNTNTNTKQITNGEQSDKKLSKFPSEQIIRDVLLKYNHIVPEILTTNFVPTKKEKKENSDGWDDDEDDDVPTKYRDFGYELGHILSSYSTLVDCLFNHTYAIINGDSIKSDYTIFPTFIEKLSVKLDKIQENNLSAIANCNTITKKLTNLQTGTVNWMMNREKNPVSEYLTDNKFFRLPDGRVWNYCNKQLMDIGEYNRKKINICGGIIVDDVHENVILQTIALALSEQEKFTLVLVENDNMKKKWNDEIKLQIEHIPIYLTVITYLEFSSYNKPFERLILDNFDLICYKKDDNTTDNDNLYFTKAVKSKCDYKWAIMPTFFKYKSQLSQAFKFLSNGGYEERYANTGDVIQNFTNSTCIFNKYYEYLYPIIIKKNIFTDKKESDKPIELKIDEDNIDSESESESGSENDNVDDEVGDDDDDDDDDDAEAKKSVKSEESEESEESNIDDDAKSEKSEKFKKLKLNDDDIKSEMDEDE